MSGKAGKSIYWVGDTFTMRHCDQERHGGQSKTKSCATVPEKTIFDKRTMRADNLSQVCTWVDAA